jgi:hypothetical protein
MHTFLYINVGYVNLNICLQKHYWWVPMDMTLYDPLPTYKVMQTFIFELGIHFYIKTITFQPLIYIIRVTQKKNLQKYAVFINVYFNDCVYKIITAPQNKAKRACVQILYF